MCITCGVRVTMAVTDGACTDTMYEEFLAHPRMSGVRGRAVWIHVDVPGQGKHQPDLPPEYVPHSVDHTPERNSVIKPGFHSNAIACVACVA